MVKNGSLYRLLTNCWPVLVVGHVKLTWIWINMDGYGSVPNRPMGRSKPIPAKVPRAS